MTRGPWLMDHIPMPEHHLWARLARRVLYFLFFLHIIGVIVCIVAAINLHTPPT